MLDVACHSCSHRFQRTAAQVLSEGVCPRCASTDIDLADNVPVTASSEIQAQGTCQRCHEHKALAGAGALCQDCLDALDRGEPLRLESAKLAIGPNPFCESGLHSECSGFMCGCPCHAYTVSPAVEAKLAELGEPERGLCPRCNTAQLSAATGRCSQCGYEVMSEHEANAVDWLTELRRLQSEEGLSFDDALARVNAMPQHQSALTEPTDPEVPGSKKCPACGENQYDGKSCSKCGYTPDDGVYASKVAGHGDPGFCQVCGQAIRPGANKGSFVHYDSALELAHQAEPNPATLEWYQENAAEYLASRRVVAYDTHCPYCGQEGCSPNCPGPSSTGICPECGGGMSDGKCNDPQGCGYGWEGDRGLTSDGEPRYAAKVSEITEAVLGSNPGMPRKTASAIAEETIRRYPKVLG